MELIQDGKKLNSYIDASLKVYKTAGARIHLAIVSALFLAAATGQNAYLNRIYPALRSNDQQAMKLFIRRAQIINGMILGGAGAMATPEGLSSEEVVAFAAAGEVVQLVKGEFIVVKGHTTDEAKSLASLVINRLAKPDGEVDKAVLERNNFAEVKTLGDTQVLDALLKLAKEVEAGSTDKKTVKVSNPIAKLLARIKNEAEAIKAANSHEAAA